MSNSDGRGKAGERRPLYTPPLPQRQLVKRQRQLVTEGVASVEGKVLERRERCGEVPKADGEVWCGCPSLLRSNHTYTLHNKHNTYTATTPTQHLHHIYTSTTHLLRHHTNTTPAPHLHIYHTPSPPPHLHHTYTLHNKHHTYTATTPAPHLHIYHTFITTKHTPHLL
ncbi:hypothetical protein Pmani_000088 [Petrolisthes manimaculis]|uniref:Uncharacterized protein n=1 Tax=Petrolisthes manimaculis TaxID=1843537 RepID=A0AAE1QMN6_9EUCA|nr:hypothetical protein Pmani_000088 [Petrolisthes manimaculis]